MVVTGILAGTMVLFIRRPVQNYTDAAARADLSDAADLALRRMARELRSALPNSVRLTVNNGVWWLEFIPIISGGQYLAIENDRARGAPLDFTNPVATPFSVVGPMPNPVPTVAPAGPNNYIVIYNLGVGFLGADAYARSNLARITGVNNDSTISFERYRDNDALGNGINPFADQANPNSSPGRRFQVVTEPVTFRCHGLANGKGTLTRSVAANFLPAQPTPTAAAGALLANNVVACNFSIGTTATQQSALIGLSIALGRPDINGGNAVETVTLTHQIHVDNTP